MKPYQNIKSYDNTQYFINIKDFLIHLSAMLYTNNPSDLLMEISNVTHRLFYEYAEIKNIGKRYT